MQISDKNLTEPSKSGKQLGQRTIIKFERMFVDGKLIDECWIGGLNMTVDQLVQAAKGLIKFGLNLTKVEIDEKKSIIHYWLETVKK